MVDSLTIKEVSFSSKNDVQLFLDNAGNTLDNFRYFDKRDLSVIENHSLTLLAYENNIPVGYGHLDKENKKIWLGIAVIESCKGKGYGNAIFNYLMNYANSTREINEIFLSVDKVNHIAISMYKKNGFIILNEVSNNIFFMKKVIE